MFLDHLKAMRPPGVSSSRKEAEKEGEDPEPQQDNVSFQICLKIENKFIFVFYQGDETLLFVEVHVEEGFSHFSLDTDESYELELSEPEGGVLQTAVLTARTWYGLHHAFETLAQLISWNSITERFQIYTQVVCWYLT